MCHRVNKLMSTDYTELKLFFSHGVFSLFSANYRKFLGRWPQGKARVRIFITITKTKTY